MSFVSIGGVWQIDNDVKTQSEAQGFVTKDNATVLKNNERCS